MKRSLLVALLLGLAVVVVNTSVAFAQNCGSPPSTSGSMGDWARAYAKWCGCMGGTFDANRGACVGVGGGGNGSGSSDANAAAAAEAERERQAEADRQRQREAEEQRLRDEEAARQRQADFDRKKREALDSMKDISGNELGLKGTEAGDLGLKDLGDTGPGLKDDTNPPPSVAATRAGCQWGDQSTSVVDLRCLGLDPERPIAVDPHVVRGEQRVFSAQVDLTLFDDPDYKKAMEAEVRPGEEIRVQTMDQAIQYFKRAQLKRPNDPVVHQALLLAETLLQGRMQQRQDNKNQAVQQLYHGLAALMTGDMVTAGDSIKRAGELDPTNPNVANWSLTVAAMKAHFQGADHDVKTVEQLVGNALTSEAWGNYNDEVSEMKMAQHLSHDDKYVVLVLDHAQHLAKENPVRGAMHPGSPTTQTPAQKNTVHN